MGEAWTVVANPAEHSILQDFYSSAFMDLRKKEKGKHFQLKVQQVIAKFYTMYSNHFQALNDIFQVPFCSQSS